MANPVWAKIYYPVIEKIHQSGEYEIDGKKIRGYRLYYYNSALWLMWKIPKSKKDLYKAVQKWSWRTPEIKYDKSKLEIAQRHQDQVYDYNESHKQIKEYDKFNGEERTLLSSLAAKKGPEIIKVCYDNGEEKDIRVTKGNATLKRLKEKLK
jgi:hypothetical protein